MSTRKIFKRPRQSSWPKSASSWRWPSDEAFRDNVDPLHMNVVQHVRHSWILKSWLTSLHDYFEALSRFSEACEDLRRRLKMGDREMRRLTKPTDRTVLEIGHYGERLLLYRRRLSQSSGVQDFISEKDVIEHAAHKRHRRTLPIEIKRLSIAADGLLKAMFEDMRTADEFIVFRIRDIPHELHGDFYIARDLFSVGFDEQAIFALTRGFEHVARQILRERKVRLKVRDDVVDAAEARLVDVIDVLGRLRWRTSGERFMPASAQQMLHWLRVIRNESAHEALPIGMDPYEFGPIIADAANALYREHDRSRRRPLKRTEF